MTSLDTPLVPHDGSITEVRGLFRARSTTWRAWSRLPSVADGAHEEACSAAADAVVALFADAGVDDVRRVPTDDGSDAVIGHTPAPEGAPTVLLYSHYDVQPADPTEWASSPWELTERDGRLYGRGAADCKGNLVMLLTALRALPRPWPVGVRVVCEGSEEMSKGGLGRLVGTDPDLFAADVMLIADAGNVELGTPDRDHEPARHRLGAGDRPHDGRARRTRGCTAAPRPTRSPR